ncbi:MAG: LacI family DNA-binding transcriptional regulator [Christensenellales bacterium]|jgi:LacI family transcriptional regulator
MRKPTIQDVADLANVSTATVSIVINNTRPVGKDIRRRVLDAIKELHYTPNRIARGLRMKSTKTIGIVIADIGLPHFTTFVRACEDTAYKYGYNIILCNTDEDPVKETRYINVLAQSQIDGIILSPTCKNPEQIEEVIASGIPIVLFDRCIRELNTNYVGYDNFGASYQATMHLIDQGYHDICMLYSLVWLTAVQDRIDGCLAALEKRGIPLSPQNMIEFPVLCSCDEFIEVLHDKLAGRPHPTGMIALESKFSAYTVNYMNTYDIKCPESVGLIGIGDFDLYIHARTFISTVEIPTYKMGEQAVSMLISTITDKSPCSQRVVFDTELAPRQSTNGYAP